MKKLEALLLFIVVVIIGTATYFFIQNSRKVTDVVPKTFVSSDEQLLQEIAKKYPATISWGPVKQTRIIYQQYNKDYNPEEIKLPVSQLIGSGKIGSGTLCSDRCESELLKTRSWQEDNNQAADGPTGSQWGYIQSDGDKKRIIQVIYTNVSREKWDRWLRNALVKLLI